MEVKGCPSRNRWHFCENGNVWNGVRPTLRCLDITCLCMLSFLLNDFSQTEQNQLMSTPQEQNVDWENGCMLRIDIVVKAIKLHSFLHHHHQISIVFLHHHCRHNSIVLPPPPPPHYFCVPAPPPPQPSPHFYCFPSIISTTATTFYCFPSTTNTTETTTFSLFSSTTTTTTTTLPLFFSTTTTTTTFPMFFSTTKWCYKPRIFDAIKKETELSVTHLMLTFHLYLSRWRLKKILDLVDEEHESEDEENESSSDEGEDEEPRIKDVLSRLSRAVSEKRASDLLHSMVASKDLLFWTCSGQLLRNKRTIPVTNIAELVVYDSLITMRLPSLVRWIRL